MRGKNQKRQAVSLTFSTIRDNSLFFVMPLPVLSGGDALHFFEDTAEGLVAVKAALFRNLLNGRVTVCQQRLGAGNAQAVYVIGKGAVKVFLEFLAQVRVA